MQSIRLDIAYMFYIFFVCFLKKLNAGMINILGSTCCAYIHTIMEKYPVFNEHNIPVIVYYATRGAIAGIILSVYDKHYQLRRNVRDHIVKNNTTCIYHNIALRLILGNNFQFIKFIYNAMPILASCFVSNFDIGHIEYCYQIYTFNMPVNNALERYNFPGLVPQLYVIMFCMLSNNIGFASGYYIGYFLNDRIKNIALRFKSFANRVFMRIY